MPGSWSAAVKTGVVSVVSVSAVAFGSIVIATFQGHALASDVAAYEKANDARLTALEEKFIAQVQRFEDERVLQAAFRGAVSVKLGLDLEKPADG